MQNKNPRRIYRRGFDHSGSAPSSTDERAAERRAVAFPGLAYPEAAALNKPPPLRAINQWNCSSSVEPVRALTDDVPPWITVVTSS